MCDYIEVYIRITITGEHVNSHSSRQLESKISRAIHNSREDILLGHPDNKTLGEYTFVLHGQIDNETLNSNVVQHYLENLFSELDKEMNDTYILRELILSQNIALI